MLLDDHDAQWKCRCIRRKGHGHCLVGQLVKEPTVHIHHVPMQWTEIIRLAKREIDLAKTMLTDVRQIGLNWKDEKSIEVGEIICRRALQHYNRLKISIWTFSTGYQTFSAISVQELDVQRSLHDLIERRGIVAEPPSAVHTTSKKIQQKLLLTNFEQKKFRDVRLDRCYQIRG